MATSRRLSANPDWDSLLTDVLENCKHISPVRQGDVLNWGQQCYQRLWLLRLSLEHLYREIGHLPYVGNRRQPDQFTPSPTLEFFEGPSMEVFRPNSVLILEFERKRSGAFLLSLATLGGEQWVLEKSNLMRRCETKRRVEFRENWTHWPIPHDDGLLKFSCPDLIPLLQSDHIIRFTSNRHGYNVLLNILGLQNSPSARRVVETSTMLFHLCPQYVRSFGRSVVMNNMVRDFLLYRYCGYWFGKRTAHFERGPENPFFPPGIGSLKKEFSERNDDRKLTFTYFSLLLWSTASMLNEYICLEFTPADLTVPSTNVPFFLNCLKEHLGHRRVLLCPHHSNTSITGPQWLRLWTLGEADRLARAQLETLG